MTGIVIGYARFLEVQQRRARIVAELLRAHDTPGRRLSLAVTDRSSYVSKQPAPALNVATTRGAVDGKRERSMPSLWERWSAAIAAAMV